MSGYAITSIKLITATPSGGISAGIVASLQVFDLSTHGEKVAFDWYGYDGSTLAAGASSYNWNTYVRDTESNSTSLVASEAFLPAISGDGTVVSFLTWLPLAPGDSTNYDVYLRNLQTGAATLVSHVSGSASGGNYNSGVYGSPVSADGQRVAFTSQATNLTGDAGVSGYNIFVTDTATGLVSLVSRANGASGTASNNAFYLDIAASGQYVSFYSFQPLTADAAGRNSIYLRDVQANTTILVSRADGATGAAANTWTGLSGVSANGRYVVFDSAENLAAGDSNNGGIDVFLRDTVDGTTKLISRASGAAGAGGTGASYSPSISDDGRYVAFSSDSPNLVAGDTNNTSDIFVRDTVANTTTRISVGLDGSQTSFGFSQYAKISGDGHHVAFFSTDTQTLAGIAPNGYLQLFMATLSGAPDAPGIVRLVDDVPLFTGNIAAGGLTNDATPGVVVSLANATAGDTLTLLLDGASIASTTLNAADIAAGSVTLAASVPTDGAHIFTATLGNSGGTSDPSATFVFRLDTAGPAISSPDLAPASDTGISATDNLTKLDTLTFTGTTEANLSVALFADGKQVGAGNADAAGGWSITTTPLAAGSRSVTAIATDAAGNVGTSGALTVTIDQTGPSVLLLRTSDGSLTFGETAVIYLATSEQVRGVEAADFTVAGGSLGAPAGNASLLGFGFGLRLPDGTFEPLGIYPPGTFWTSTFTPTGNASGSATLQLTGAYFDDAGNAGSASGLLTMAYDTRLVTAQPPVDPNVVTGPRDFTISTNIPLVGLEVSDFSENIGNVTSLTGGPTAFTGTYTPPANTEGTATISVSGANYAAGNGSPGVDISFNLNVDTLAPTVTVTTSNQLVNGTQTAIITYTFSEAVTGLEQADLDVLGGAISAPTGSGKIWEATFTPGPNYEGFVSAGIKPFSYTDLAGNPGTPGSKIFRVDSIAPVLGFTGIDIDSGRSTTDLITNDTNLIFLGTISEAGTLKVEQQLLPDGKWSTLDAAAAVNPGNISFGPTTELTDGTRQFLATPTDIAGNIGKAVTLTVTTDTKAPAAPELSGITIDTNTPDDRVTSDHTLFFTGTAEANSLVVLSRDGKTLGQAIAGADRTFIIDARSTNLPDGTLQFTATATDLAGNTSAPSGKFQVIVFPGDIKLDTGPVWYQTLTGDYGDDTLTAAGGFNTALGAYGDDLITLGGYANTILGGDGNDTIDAGEGLASIDGGAGDDRITARGYNNTIQGGAGNDVINAGDGNSRIDGGAGNNTITVGGYNNTIQGGAGNDLVYSVDGNSSFNLGDGNNEIHARGFNNIVTLGHGNNIVEDFDGNSTITAGNGNNIITLHGFSNIVTLGSGANLLLLLGGGHNTVTTTGGGNILRAEGNGNLITLGGDAGSNTAVFSGPLAGYSFAHLDSPTRGHGLAVTATGPGWTLDLFNVEKLQFANGVDLANYSGATQGLMARLDIPSLNTGDAAGDNLTGVEGLIGSHFADILVGDEGANTILAGLGADYVAGVGGADSLFGEGGNDTLEGGTGADALNGGDGFDFATYRTSADGVTARLDYPALNTGDAQGDTYSGIEGLIGTGFFDFLVGDDGANTIYAGGTWDYVAGNAGNDLIFGEDGTDTLDGGTGDDTLVGGTGADSLLGGGGIDFASYATAAAGVTARLDFASLNTGDAAGDSYTAISGLLGSEFADTLIGAGGSQTLSGGAGGDALVGGKASDTLYGGAGVDFFGFAVEDFEAGVWDVIKDMNAGGEADWFVTSGIARPSIWALDWQGGIVVTIADVGFGNGGGGVFIENFTATQFWSQLYTL